MTALTKEIENILMDRFSKDSIIALATTGDGMPYVRNVDAFYADGAFYVLTHRLSSKMKQIEKNPTVAIAGDWFTAHGIACNMGAFNKTENSEIAEKMTIAFSDWIHNGHSNLQDSNTCILRIELTGATLFSHGTRYDIDFSK